MIIFVVLNLPYRILRAYGTWSADRCMDGVHGLPTGAWASIHLDYHGHVCASRYSDSGITDDVYTQAGLFSVHFESDSKLDESFLLA